MTIPSEDAEVIQGFAVDGSDLPEQYLTKQEAVFKAKFDVLMVCNLIFYKDRILLLKMTDDVKAWSNKLGTPMYRLSRVADDADVRSFLNLRVDRAMEEDVAVEEYGRVACRTQIGLDPGMLHNSRAATALHTAVSPQKLPNSLWLRASLLWKVDDMVELKPDQYVCKDTVWMTEQEVQEADSEMFFMGLKEDIVTSFNMRRRRGSSIA